MDQITSKKWWKAAATRAIKTVAQTAAAGLTTAVAQKLGMGTIDWAGIISVAVVAGVYSVLTSLGGLPEVKEE